MTPTRRRAIITLTTDFGLQDPYVGALKAAILEVDPEARIVDISHQVPQQGIVAGGYVLACAFPFFPPGSVHVLVVDPGVGTSRRLLLARTENHVFLAPDNGVLGLAFAVEPPREIFSITASRYFRKEIRPTFHGRDILAPVAARVARGMALTRFGPPAEEWTPFPIPSPVRTAEGRIPLRVLAVDRFGNVILNLKESEFKAFRSEAGGEFTLHVGGRKITRLLKTYGEAPDREPFALFGSFGYLEIAVREGSAAEAMSVSPDQTLVLSL